MKKELRYKGFFDSAIAVADDELQDEKWRCGLPQSISLADGGDALTPSQEEIEQAMMQDIQQSMMDAQDDYYECYLDYDMTKWVE